MMKHVSDKDLKEALDGCASEAVHIPGTIQPNGWLIGCDVTTGLVRYASQNCHHLFGIPLNALFGQPIADVLGSEIWHNCLNLIDRLDLSERRCFAGLWQTDPTDYSIHVSRNAENFVLEIEAADEMPSLSPEMLREQNFLINQIRSCEDEQSLFDLTTRLLRHLTGFDRVMIYKFDAEWNGSVLAEARRPSMEPYLGLRFPHWDIPSQARQIMARLPLRLISDVDQTTIPLVAANSELPPLDISYAHLRGVSPVHMQYLSNMGTVATMTLSVMLDDGLWGMISFHHSRPRIAPSPIRQILVNGVLPIFILKLELLRSEAVKKLSEQIDFLQSDIQAELEQGSSISNLMAAVGPAIGDALDVCGMAVVAGSQTYSYGRTPPQAVIEALARMARETNEKSLVIQSFAEALPHLAGQFEDTAGALVTSFPKDRGLFLFRPEIDQSVAWAGDPEKTVEIVDGNKRLQPRGSFSTYLESVRGRCNAWSDNDRHMAQQLWPLLSAGERQAFLNDLSRQQNLMIGELNHRVHNILALVNSVSNQARLHGGSLESYSQALEARIHALAAAHNIGSGAAMSAVPVKQMIALETAPFQAKGSDRVRVHGADISIRADMAPLFTLVVHELMTNTVKYGALSVPEGSIDITLSLTEEGMEFSWVEQGGPPVKQPDALGFGSTLIQQAIPYEMNGQSELIFNSHGVSAKLTVPLQVLELEPNDGDPDRTASRADATISDIPAILRDGLILIVEDNFMIASDLADAMNTIGFPNCETLSNPANAMEFLDTETPALALLDVNLGNGQTSEAVASKLVRSKVPIIFVTGYGERTEFPPHLKQAPVLTKPISQKALLGCISQISA
jgi:light-regulated signal transduction histidine kinase (bacteriophytochrome)